MKNLLMIIMILVSTLTADGKYAGFRSSRVMPGSFPEPEYWSNVCHILADKFDNAEPAGVWIVSTYWGNGLCRLHFPHPDNGKNYENISFDTRDLNEPYFDMFDSTGVKVWLQVESGDANMDTLISLVMKRYQHHDCVIGFGVDNEWYFNGPANDYWGEAVTDEESERWEKAVQAYDSTYTLTMKHWATKNMPQKYRGEIIFVDDSQDFDSMNDMVNEFKYWGNYYKNNPVIYQFGYDSDVDSDGDNDKDWWGNFDDPAKTIGDELFANISNCLGIYWVDFTIKDVFPVDDVLAADNENQLQLAQQLALAQNYPNPFNGHTTIEFTIHQKGFFKLILVDLQGGLVKVLFRDHLTPNTYQYDFNARGLSSGVYYYQLIGKDTQSTRKMIYMK